MNTHAMWKDYPQLEKDLSRVTQLIDSHIRIRDKQIRATLKEVVHAGGKLLRPAYTLLCSQMGAYYDRDKAIALAAAVETLHMATLVHDDVIDDAATRRGKATLQNTHGNKFAIYAGDYLFSISFAILSKHSGSLEHLAYNSRSMERILIGELDQLHSRFKPASSVKDYLARISGKTAQLFAVSCYTGAIESKATKRQARHAWYMGHYIGMAFQIIDDILDYEADASHVGKPVMADVRQGIYTLPLIYALAKNEREIKPILEKKQLSDEELDRLITLIRQERGLANAKKLASRYTEKALTELNKLPNGPYKDTLFELTSQMLKRTM
ncbi:heptaprenyl diphosphate synthase [Amphibacillus marinus]|uniref:Heptaprenyl diphosphate synthase n=1 Tax=Amphibacillus marinus TaxID=872970 RepID=A0A1H8TLY0_9BACI|nr:polyprenyl synthetase family protein [Amphibacillus marinus]SEO91816.1 heptaprenyl diphosphate synthase [Amphibacillus marinus]